jgi:hypothetical protein
LNNPNTVTNRIKILFVLKHRSQTQEIVRKLGITSKNMGKKAFMKAQETLGPIKPK